MKKLTIIIISTLFFFSCNDDESTATVPTNSNNCSFHYVTTIYDVIRGNDVIRESTIHGVCQVSNAYSPFGEVPFKEYKTITFNNYEYEVIIKSTFEKTVEKTGSSFEENVTITVRTLYSLLVRRGYSRTISRDDGWDWNENNSFTISNNDKKWQMIDGTNIHTIEFYQ